IRLTPACTRLTGNAARPWASRSGCSCPARPSSPAPRWTSTPPAGWWCAPAASGERCQPATSHTSGSSANPDGCQNHAVELGDKTANGDLRGGPVIDQQAVVADPGNIGHTVFL